MLLKQVPNFVLGRLSNSTYWTTYASLSNLPAVSLDDLFEQPGKFASFAAGLYGKRLVLAPPGLGG